MKNKLVLVFFLLCIVNLYAEGPRSKRRSNPNYKNLKIYVKVLNRYNMSNFYSAQIDIVNTGNSTVSFWETPEDYSELFFFSAFGIKFINKTERLYYEKKISKMPSQLVYEVKIKILPHKKHIIKTQIYLYNKKRFLETNKNLNVVFIFHDANLGFYEEEVQPKIYSDNTIKYNW